MTTPSPPRVLTEVVVIVGSILLAFALDAWWDGRQEDGRVNGLLSAVADEFEAELLVLDSVISANEAGVALGQALLVGTMAPAGPPADEDAFADSLSGRPDYQIYDPSFGALTALITSGGLERVRDPELRRRLAGWSAELEDLEWERSQVYDAVQNIFDRLRDLGLTTRMPVAGDGIWEVRARGMVRDPYYREVEAEVVTTYWLYTSDLVRVRARAAELLDGIRSHVESPP